MKRKKYGAFAVTAAALLVMTLLVTNCSGPLNFTEQNRSRGVSSAAPPGYGGIMVGVVDRSGAARTIMPGVPGEFDSYQVVIRRYNRTSAPGITPPVFGPGHRDWVHTIYHLLFSGAGGSATTTFYVPPGWYYVAVYAFTNGEPGDDPALDVNAPIDRGVPGTELAARGVSEGFQVYVGMTGSVVITLEALFTATDATHPGADIYRVGQGTFAWDISLPNAITTPGSDTVTASMSLTALSGQTIGGDWNEPQNLLTTAQNITGVSLPVGFYRVTIDLTRTTGTPPRATHNPRRISEILQVAQNLTSTQHLVIPDLISLQRRVTFDQWDGRTDAQGIRFIDYLHGELLTDIDTFETYLNPPEFHRTPRRVFDGWWTTRGTFDSTTDVPENNWGREWDPDTSIIIRNITLFARWLPVTTVNLTVNPVVGDANNIGEMPYRIVHQSQFVNEGGDLNQIIINLASPTTGAWSNVNWRDGGNISNVWLDHGPSLIINLTLPASAHLLSETDEFATPHRIDVEATDEDGIRWSGFIHIYVFCYDSPYADLPTSRPTGP